MDADELRAMAERFEAEFRRQWNAIDHEGNDRRAKHRVTVERRLLAEGRIGRGACSQAEAEAIIVAEIAAESRRMGDV